MCVDLVGIGMKMEDRNFGERRVERGNGSIVPAIPPMDNSSNNSDSYYVSTATEQSVLKSDQKSAIQACSFRCEIHCDVNELSKRGSEHSGYR